MPNKRLKIPFEGLLTSVDPTQIGLGKAAAISNADVDLGILQMGPRDAFIGQSPTAMGTDLAMGLGYGRYTSNATFSLQVSGFTGGTPATSGYVRFTLGGNQTAASTLGPNSTAAQVAAAFQALPQFANGAISASGGPWPFQVINVTYQGLFGGQPQALPTLTDNSFNNSATVTISSLVTGGTSDLFLDVIQPQGAGNSTLWGVSSSDGYNAMMSWTSIATNLNSNRWLFRQFADKIYAVNGSVGLCWYQIGGGWSQPAGIPSTNPPTIVSAVQSDTYSGGIIMDPAHASPPLNPSPTFAFGNWGATNPAVTHDLASLLTLAVAAAITVPTKVAITITPASAYPWTNQHYFQVQIACDIEAGGGAGDLPNIDYSSISLSFNNAANQTTIPLQSDAGNLYGGLPFTGYRGFYFGETTEGQMAAVTAVILEFTINSATAKSKLNILVNPDDSWMQDQILTLSILEGPTQTPIQYAATYVQQSTQLETALGTPVGVSMGFGKPFGFQTTITVDTELVHLTAADMIRLYRLDQFGIWRMIFQTPQGSGGTFVFNDAYMADEITGFPPYGIVPLPGGFMGNALEAWNGSLIQGADRKIWLGYTGIPIEFAPDPSQFGALDAYDPSDPNIPRTAYMSADRSEVVQAIVPQGPIYFAGPNTTYAMAGGNQPDSLSPPTAIENSHGCVFATACSPLNDGAMFFSQLGLYYYSVPAFFGSAISGGQPITEELTKEVRGSVKNFIGGDPSDLLPVTVVYQVDEIWCFFGAKYMRRTRNGHWVTGTLTHPTLHAIPSQYNGLIGVGLNGTLWKMGGANPSATTWSYQTGIVEGERAMLDHMEIWCTPGCAVELQWWDFNGDNDIDTNDMQEGNVWVPAINPAALQQGWRWQLTVTGGNSDQVTSLIMEVVDLPGGKGN